MDEELNFDTLAVRAGITRSQFGEHAESRAVQALCTAQVNPDAGEGGVVEHPLKIVVDRGAQSEAHVALEANHIGAVMAGSEYFSGLHLSHAC
mgnify:CR=1 FL=1